MQIKFLHFLSLLATISLTLVSGFSSTRRNSNPPLIGYVDSSARFGILESRSLTLNTPSVIRLGDSSIIHMTFTIDTDGNLGVTMEPGEKLTGVWLADVFERYIVIAEAELDLPLLTARPLGLISQPLNPGQSISFSWSVQPRAVGEYQGTVWFRLRFIPREIGSEFDFPVAALTFTFRVVSLAGLTGNLARLLGVIGLMIGLILLLPFLVDGLDQRLQVHWHK